MASWKLRSIPRTWCVRAPSTRACSGWSRSIATTGCLLMLCQAHLASRGVYIEGRNNWERGGRQPLFPRSGRSPFGTGNAGIVVDLLGTRLASTDPGRSDVRFGSKADICSANRHVRFPPKADMCGVIRDVRFVPTADIAQSFDQLVGAGRKGRWHFEAERLRGAQIDY